MLNRLKWRFIRINMLLVGVAVAIMFGSVCMLTYRNGRSQIDRAMDNALRLEDRPNGLDFGSVPQDPPAEIPQNAPNGQVENPDVRLPSFGGKDNLSYIYTVTVVVLPDGSYLRADAFGADIDSEVLDQAVKKASASKRQSGTIRSLDLAWKRTQTPAGKTKIVFASTDYLSNALRTTALISGGVSLVSLLLFFGVSYLLAGIVIRPTADAWDKQKRFVADASHDLKTPLTVILANTEILRKNPDSAVSEQMQWIDGTAEEADRMRGLVDEMLELAKSEDAKQSLVLSPVCLSDLLERTVLQFEPVAFEQGVSLETNVAPDVTLPCHADSFVRLSHILIDNAIKYSQKGQPVTVSLTPVGTGAVFSVKNLGNPIPPADIPHLFERFYRADKARSVGGFGLGLSIAKNLADSLHAKISVTSSTDGTVFTVKFLGR